MYNDFQKYLEAELQSIREAGLYKEERVITSAQQAAIKVAPDKDVLNFCANNYLGLANNAQLVEAAKQALDTHGYGMSSVRFICGTGDLHKELEKKISEFFGTEDASTTPSSPMRSTTPRSSTAFACARPSATATPTPTWTSWKTA